MAYLGVTNNEFYQINLRANELISFALVVDRHRPPLFDRGSRYVDRDGDHIL